MKAFFLLCVVAFITLHEVIGNPNEEALQDSELTDFRGKRQIGEIIGAGIGVGVDLAKEAIVNAGRCAEKAGCYKGYCWTYCGLSLSSGDWCYTTKSYSQSFKYVTCNNDSQCDRCWKCAGSCTL